MSTENLKVSQIENTISQSDIGHYIGKGLDNFSNANTDKGFWKLYDKNNPANDGDQAKTVFGICFTFLVLLVLGTYSYLL